MKKRALRLFIILAALIALTAGSAGAIQGLREEDNNFFVSADPEFEKLIDRVMRTSRHNGFKGSILIATDGGIILYGGPDALTTDGAPADLHTTYNIGSCSKTFTAVAVFQLIEAGLLSLDDPLSRFFPDYAAGGEITIDQMLHMQSGIVDYINDPTAYWVNVDPQDMDRFLAGLFGDDVSDAVFLENLYAAPLEFEPGTTQRYSNTNYHLLAMIVERITGMRYCDYLQAHIFDACGLEHTTSMVAGNETSVPKDFLGLKMAGYVDEKGYSMMPNQERGDGGIHTCIADLWAFDRALVSGQLVGADSLEEMKRFDMGYGCGLYPYKKNAYGHSGRDGTYTTQNVIIETEAFGKVYLVISTSTEAGVYGLDALLKVALPMLGKL